MQIPGSYILYQAKFLKLHHKLLKKKSDVNKRGPFFAFAKKRCLPYPLAVEVEFSKKCKFKANLTLKVKGTSFFEF